MNYKSISKIKILSKTFLSFLISITLISCNNTKKKQKKTERDSDPITSSFKEEVIPNNSKPCFDGAYYRKVVSSEDVWLGINGKVVLPNIIFDEDRINPARPEQYLDNPSVYLGGKMGGQETDIGLTWEVIRDENGNVTPDRRAFRPFLRRASYKDTQGAAYKNAPAESQYYWYPGEEVKMSIQIINDKKLKFVVEGAGKRYETEFEADGYFPNHIGEFKRVNAIDQVGNEGKPAQATKTKVENATWIETNLYRSYQGELVLAPMHNKRFTDMRCPDESYFNIVSTKEEQEKGAETITIDGHKN